jgi:SulP family sulfate permease
MFVVAAETFNWKSLSTLRRIPPHDTLVMVTVTLVTVFTNLAVAVVTGIVLAALVFAWDHAQQLEVSIEEGENTRTYRLRGTLFFASATQFTRLFHPLTDPAHVLLDFDHARIMDSSALEAIEALSARYTSLGKQLHLHSLSESCDRLLRRKDGPISLLESQP